jgi:hypothetical protein
MRSRPPARAPRTNQPPDAPSAPPDRRGRRVVFVLAALASIALVLAACGSGSSTTAPAAGAGTGTGTGTGVVTRAGSASGSQSGDRSTGSYSVAFATCMRAHGLPKFPNPNGKGSQLGPDSGINPASPAFQAAVNGPCESLAPQGWVSSGPVTK